MKWGKTFAGTVALAAIIALSWLVVPTAGAGDKREHEGDKKFEHEVLKLLNRILANDKREDEGDKKFEHRVRKLLNDILATEQGIRASLRTGLDSIRVQLDGLLVLEENNICTAPDLVPIPDPNPQVGFCRFDAQGKLLLRVHNQGGAAAGPSQTLVVFRTRLGAQDLFVDTPPLAGFTGTNLAIDTPDDCFGNFFGQGDNNVCKFEILVDAQIGSSVGAVAESNELNNAAFGGCQGLL